MWTFSNLMIRKDYEILDSHESIFPLNPSPKEIPWERSVGYACQRSARGVVVSLWRDTVEQSLTWSSILDQ